MKSKTQSVDGDPPLYANFLKSREWQDGVYEQLIHKALDLPTEPKGIKADRNTTINNHNGLGWKAALAAATILTGGAVGGTLGLANLLSPKTQTPQTPQTEQRQVQPVTVDPARAKVELYYDDPVEGLIPIQGAAGEQGARVKP